MDRGISRDERPDEQPAGSGREKFSSDPARNRGEAWSQPSPARPGNASQPPFDQPIRDHAQRGRARESDRVPIDQDRDRDRPLSQNARETAEEIGRFRTLTVNDLAQQKYAGDVAQMRRELQSLKAQGLVQLRTIWAGNGTGKVEFVALTPEGKRLIESETSRTGQVFYCRFVKPAEILHDAAIYRMYQAERVRIEQEGGRVCRVVLDYELKQKAYPSLAKAKALPPLDYAHRQQEIAQENGLKVVQGHITLPDLRIEYETAEGDQTRVDLELATGNYHGSHLASKAEAGFKMYAADGSAGRLNSVLEEREITAEIFSL